MGEKKFLAEESEEYKELKKQWNERARKIHTIDEFVEFYNDLYGKYTHDYGVCIGAASCLAMAGANLAAHQDGLTNFQMSCVMWDYIHWMHYPQSQTGMRLQHFDDMLYPQYDYKFQKTIEYNTWDKLKELAKEKLEDNITAKIKAAPNVLAHWQSIVNGEIPFGYKLFGVKKI